MDQRRRRTWWWTAVGGVGGLMLALLALPTAQAQEQAKVQAPVPPAPPVPARAVTIAQALTLLQAEAAVLRTPGKDWPSLESDFAQRHGLSVDPKEAARVLCRRLSANPAIDGYIKWQLLSFAPDLGSLGMDEQRQLIRSLPPLVAEPDATVLAAYVPPDEGSPSMGLFTGTQTAYSAGPYYVPGSRTPGARLGVVTSGSGIVAGGWVSPDGRTVDLTVRATSAALTQLRRQAVFLNAGSARYRQAVVSALPRAGGVRALAMLTDVRDRVVAGEFNTHHAIERLVSETSAARDAFTLDPALRPQIVGLLRQLTHTRAYVAVEVRADAQGRPLVDQGAVFVPAQDLGPIADNLGLLDAIAQP